MINTVKDNSGYVVAYIEWEVLDDRGQFKKDGEYIYIQNVWIHESFRGLDLLRLLVDDIYRHKFSQQCKHVYWSVNRGIDRLKTISEEEKESVNKSVHQYDKEKIYNKIKGEVQCLN